MWRKHAAPLMIRTAPASQRAGRVATQIANRCGDSGSSGTDPRHGPACRARAVWRKLATPMKIMSAPASATPRLPAQVALVRLLVQPASGDSSAPYVAPHHLRACAHPGSRQHRRVSFPLVWD